MKRRTHALLSFPGPKLFAGLLAGLLATQLQGCGRDGFADTANDVYLHLVSTQPVKLSDGYEVEREFAGLVVANQNSELGFELAGRIDRLLVNEGEAVAAGQLLAELDTSLLISYRAELLAREQSVQSELQLARRNLERVEKLQQEGLASEREKDELTSRVAVLAASERELQAAMRANRLRLDKSVLVAPFAAKIGIRHADQGTVVDAGMPVFSLVESGAREVRVGIPSVLFAQLAPGQSVLVRNGNEQINSTVISLGASVDQATRTRTLRLLVDAAWTPGELAYALIPQQVELAGSWIPQSAITEGVRGTWAVYVAIPSGDATAILETRTVTVHYGEEGRLYVSGALFDADLLVESGLHRLAPRQTVRTRSGEQFSHVP